jgi:predicted amidophosphoribosyltransferase
VCRACRAAPPPYAATSAAALYGGALIAPLLAFKHGDKRHLARPLARLLGPALRASLQAGVAAVLPVPLHARRLRARGFNQALDLLRAGLGLLASEPPPGGAGAQGHGPSSPPPEILVDALVRLRDTPPLGHLSPVERRCEVSAAFAASRPAVVRGRHLLLVDDVMTTGATVAACAAALLDAGAASVRVAVLARAWPGAA